MVEFTIQCTNCGGKNFERTRLGDIVEGQFTVEAYVCQNCRHIEIFESQEEFDIARERRQKNQEREKRILAEKEALKLREKRIQELKEIINNENSTIKQVKEAQTELRNLLRTPIANNYYGKYRC